MNFTMQINVQSILDIFVSTVHSFLKNAGHFLLN